MVNSDRKQKCNDSKYVIPSILSSVVINTSAPKHHSTPNASTLSARAEYFLNRLVSSCISRIARRYERNLRMRTTLSYMTFSHDVERMSAP